MPWPSLVSMETYVAEYHLQLAEGRASAAALACDLLDLLEHNAPPMSAGFQTSLLAGRYQGPCPAVAARQHLLAESDRSSPAIWGSVQILLTQKHSYPVGFAGSLLQ